MALRRRIAIVWAAFFVAGAALLSAQDDKPLRLDVKLVSMFVNVTDKDGAIIGNLTQEDFNVFEDGRPQKIAIFERQSEMPLALTLAIDTSSSTYKDRGIEQVAAKKFVHAMIRAQDRMSVMQFNTDVYELCGFTSSIPPARSRTRSYARRRRNGGVVQRDLSRIERSWQERRPKSTGACF